MSERSEESVGLEVCGSVALGVSKVWGSAGMGVWQVWGSGLFLERNCEEKGRPKRAKERLWMHFRSFLGTFWKKRAERTAQAPKERSGDSPRFPVRPKVHFFLGFGCLGGRQERFREHFGSFLEPFWEAFLVRSSAESRNVEHRSRSSRLEREAL